MSEHLGAGGCGQGCLPEIREAGACRTSQGRHGPQLNTHREPGLRPRSSNMNFPQILRLKENAHIRSTNISIYRVAYNGPGILVEGNKI